MRKLKPQPEFVVTVMEICFHFTEWGLSPQEKAAHKEDS